MSIATDLEIAKAWICKPALWCKGARARSMSGDEVDVFAPNAVSFCSKGALIRVLGEDADLTEHERFLTSGTSNEENKFTVNYIGLNERHDFNRVMQMWDKAIELALAEGK